MGDTISYGIYYKMVSPTIIPNGLTIAEVSDLSSSTTYGTIDAGIENAKIVSLVIINNSDVEIKVQIGVRTGYYNDTNNVDNIIYEDGEVLISSIVDTSSVGSYVCDGVSGENCVEECYTKIEEGSINRYCGKACLESTTPEPNVPNINNGLIPVMFGGSTWVKADSTNKDEIYKWYDYDTGRWANAILVSSTNRNAYKSAEIGTVINEDDILAYYVWIPRYKYKVWNIDKTIGVDSYDAQNTGIDIVFESSTNLTGTVSCNYDFSVLEGEGIPEICVGQSGVVGEGNGEYYTHPAFWVDSDGDAMYIAYSTSPWFCRGGYYKDGDYGGIFYSFPNNGGAFNTYSTRATLISY